MTAGERLDARAREIETIVNQRIAAEAGDWSPLEYRARAQMVAEDVVPKGWQWDVVESVAGVPSIILMQFDPRAA